MEKNDEIPVQNNTSLAREPIVLSERPQEGGLIAGQGSPIAAVTEEMAFQYAKLDLGIVKTTRPGIGFLADFAYSEYTSRLFAGVVDAAERLGYSVPRFRLSGSGDNDETFQRCIAEDLAGLIIHDPDFRLPTEQMADVLRHHHLPYVLLDIRGFEYCMPGVCSDDSGGMAIAVNHLADLGHQRIMLVSGVPNFGSAILRVPGYENTMRERGIGQYINVIYPQWDEVLLDEMLLEAFRSPTPPTALICSSDAMALLALSIFNEMGIKVPRDISVVGFGNLLRTEYATPALTTITIPYEQMGREAVKMLLEEKARLRAGGHTPPSAWRYMATNLVVRRSTDVPPF